MICQIHKNNKTLKIFQIIIGASALFFLFFKYFFIHSINIKAPNSIARAQDQLPEPVYLELLNSLQEITSNMIYDDKYDDGFFLANAITVCHYYAYYLNCNCYCCHYWRYCCYYSSQ